MVASILEIALYVLLMPPLDCFARRAISRVELLIVISRVGPCHVAPILILLIEVLLETTLPFLFDALYYGLGVVCRLHCAQILGSFLI